MNRAVISQCILAAACASAAGLLMGVSLGAAPEEPPAAARSTAAAVAPGAATEPATDVNAPLPASATAPVDATPEPATADAAATLPSAATTLPTTQADAAPDSAGAGVPETMPARESATAPSTFPTTGIAAAPSPTSRPATLPAVASARNDTRDASRDKRGSSDRRSGGSSSRSSAPSAPSPVAVGSKPMPESYSILLKRSIFSKDRKTDAAPRGSGSAQQSNDPFANSGGKSGAGGRVEAAMVLTGVLLQDGQYTAFIEDSAAGRTLLLQAGAAVAHGKVAAIELDHLDYDVGGRRVRVNLGQTLDAAAPAYATGSTTQPTTGPTTGPSDPGGGATDDVVERLKRRRQSGK